MTGVPATITAELMEHADGRPIAYIDATAVAIFAYQQPDGTYVIDINTRDGNASGRLCLLLDGKTLPTSAATTASTCLLLVSPAPPKNPDSGTGSAAARRLEQRDPVGLRASPGCKRSGLSGGGTWTAVRSFPAMSACAARSFPQPGR